MRTTLTGVTRPTIVTRTVHRAYHASGIGLPGSTVALEAPCRFCCSRCPILSSTRRRSRCACRTARWHRSPATWIPIIGSPSPISCSRRRQSRRRLSTSFRAQAGRGRPVGDDVPALDGAAHHRAGAIAGPRHRASSSADTIRASRRKRGRSRRSASTRSCAAKGTSRSAN